MRRSSALAVPPARAAHADRLRLQHRHGRRAHRAAVPAFAAGDADLCGADRHRLRRLHVGRHGADDPGTAQGRWRGDRQGLGILTTAVNIPQILSPVFAAWLLSLSGGDYTRSEEHTSELQSIMRNSYAV